MDRDRPLSFAAFDTGFVQGLLERVPDQKQVEEWYVRGSRDDDVLLEANGVRTFIDREALSGQPLTAGSAVDIGVTALTLGRSPGFVLRSSGFEAVEPTSRLYLNISPAAAAWALGPLARRLEKVMPFTLKVLAHPRAYLRRDACTVYVPSDRLGDALSIVRDDVRRECVTLAPPVPRFTMQLAPGIGLADEPSDLGLHETSYGRWVSNLFLAAAQKGERPQAIAQLVVDEIRTYGRDPEHPYLRAGRTPSDLCAG